MLSYSEIAVFSTHTLRIWREACVLFDRLPQQDSIVYSQAVPRLISENPYRCHEITRAIARMLNIQNPGLTALHIQDGWYGSVEHSWLWLDRVILDVYAVGRMPPVQLVAMSPKFGHYSATGQAPSLSR